MSAGIQLQSTFSNVVLPESSEPQLLYVLVEATPHGLPKTLPKLPLNLCLVLDRSSSMRGERLSEVKEASQRIVDQMSSSDYFALVTFNDRAEVVINSQLVRNKQDIKRRIAAIDAAGGTEMASGLALALQEMQRGMMMGKVVNRILLLTDGRTYGDEGQCVQLARRAQGRQVGLTALGIGHEWNEDLLETMAARENSRTQYIASAAEVAQVFTEEMARMNSIFAQGVKLYVRLRPEGYLRSVDRVQPFIAPVQVVEERDLCWTGALGDWPGSDMQAFLLEVTVPPLTVGKHPLLQLMLRYDLPGVNATNQNTNSSLNIEICPADQTNTGIDGSVKYWLERLVAYRLQARAWQDIESGQIEDATQRLRMAGTRLLESGETELARTIEDEATRLLKSGTASAEGRKRIKYGTRGLIKRD
jgi:uncharacterized protein YegL